MNNLDTLKIGIFDKMLDPKVRDAFMARKSSTYNMTEKELSELKNYIGSPKCINDIKRLQREALRKEAASLWPLY